MYQPQHGGARDRPFIAWWFGLRRWLALSSVKSDENSVDANMRENGMQRATGLRESSNEIYWEYIKLSIVLLQQPI